MGVLTLVGVLARPPAPTLVPSGRSMTEYGRYRYSSHAQQSSSLLPAYTRLRDLLIRSVPGQKRNPARHYSKGNVPSLATRLVGVAPMPTATNPFFQCAWARLGPKSRDCGQMRRNWGSGPGLVRLYISGSRTIRARRRPNVMIIRALDEGLSRIRRRIRTVRSLTNMSRLPILNWFGMGNSAFYLNLSSKLPKTPSTTYARIISRCG